MPAPRLGSKRRKFAGEGAFAAVRGVAVDGAVFDRAIEFGAELAGFFGGGFFVLRLESSAGVAREGFEGAQGAAVAGRADFRLACAFGGGFDVGHKFFGFTFAGFDQGNCQW